MRDNTSGEAMTNADEPLSMCVPVLVDQQERNYNSFAQTHDAV